MSLRHIGIAGVAVTVRVLPGFDDVAAAEVPAVADDVRTELDGLDTIGDPDPEPDTVLEQAASTTAASEITTMSGAARRTIRPSPESDPATT
jgi:hypothetical protein